jgi:hypothetical protein
MSLVSRGNSIRGFVSIGCCAWLGLGLLVAAPAHGQGPRPIADEVREYEMLVKGKPAGKMLTRITDNDDGTTIASTDTDIKVESWFHTYRDEYHGREVWRGSHLVRADIHAVDHGKKRAAHATVNERGSVIETPGSSPQAGPKLAMTTNYWRLPDMPPGTNNLAIMESDSGAIDTVWFKRVGPEKITVNGRPIACTHFRVIGAAKAELWFDDHARLVRQQTVVGGYPTEVRLTRIHSNTPAGEAQ